MKKRVFPYESNWLADHQMWDLFFLRKFEKKKHRQRVITKSVSLPDGIQQEAKSVIRPAGYLADEKWITHPPDIG